ncbi:MAG: amidohydrolase family protein [Sulfolobales archaeon]
MVEELVMNFDSGIIGEELEEWSDGLNIVIRDGIIEHIGKGKASGRNVINFNNTFVMPPLANLHTHILDYAFPEVGWDLDIDSVVGDPYGVKYLMLSKATEHSLREAITRFLHHSWRYGIGILVEFREGGVTHASLDKDSRPLTHLVFGIPTKVINVADQVYEMKELINGVGISSPLYFRGDELKSLGRIARELNIGIHVHISEVIDTYEEDDLRYMLKYLKPDAIVHGTYLGEDELILLRELKIPLIMCLRSNLWFVGKVPNLKLIKDLGIEVGLGTDNASWVKGDLWRDLDLLTNLMRVKGVLDPKWVLRTATNAEVVGLNNRVSEGSKVNLLMINEELTSIRYSKNKYLAIIKRGGPEGVEVLINDGIIRYCSSKYETLCNNIRDRIR